MSSESPIRLFLIDDHAIVRAGLSMLMKSQPRFQIVGEAGSKNEALEARAECDVILLDLDIRGDSGLDLIAPLQDKHPSAKVLILTGMRDAEIPRKAVALGATGIVLKEHASELLLKAVECVHRGELWIDRSMMADVISGMRDGGIEKTDPQRVKIASLTERECEVVALIGEGLKNKDIAARLFLSETTVRHHLTSIFSKLEVSDRLELVIYAYRHKLIDAAS